MIAEDAARAMRRRAGAVRPGDPALARRLRAAIEGEVLFDAFSRGRYASDASIYQIEPLGVVVPKTPGDVEAAIAIATEAGAPVLPRGAGTSQAGQAVGEALVVDTTRHLTGILDLDPEARRVRVQPGIVLDRLNAALRPHGLFFPVDVSTASRATIGGMAGNNACGARSIRYGNMVHNVQAITAILADGTRAHFSETPALRKGTEGEARLAELTRALRALGERERDEVARRFPRLLRRVGGYNLDALCAGRPNLAHLLVGSEGTLAFFTDLTLQLAPLPAHRVLGVCHFPTFYRAMEATPRIVALGPSAVELMDRTLIGHARGIPMFRPAVERFVRGDPPALLLVEFAGEDDGALREGLRRLDELMSGEGTGACLVQVDEAAPQREIWELRKAGLNVLMSMKGEGKPVSFIEDCAVPLRDLAEYTRRLDEVFARHGTRGTWYAHASVGTLHVRPILNLRKASEVATMRAIAEECFAIVREYEGSHSGEHGDGLVRSEFHRAMFGERLVRAFEEVKRCFDPAGAFNPGKIVHPPPMDDRSLLRYPPDYRTAAPPAGLDWSEWGGLPAAAEMCNNNGACRKDGAGVMCPSFRVTRDEEHLTRGRANSLRLALSGRLGPEAFTSEALYRTLDLCVGCKGCRRECPTGVDVARMKIEFLHHYRRRHGVPLRERLFAWLPRLAPGYARLGWLGPLRNRSPALRALGERWLGLSARRDLPRGRRDFFGSRAADRGTGGSAAPPVALFVDTFSRWFEPGIPRAATRVLAAAGFRVEPLAPATAPRRPLCCGRTFLSAGLLDEARREAGRVLEALAPCLARGVPVIGLEPACLLTLRDEWPVLLPGPEAARAARHALLLEEFLVRPEPAGRLAPMLRPLPRGPALLHGHCHQKAFGTMESVRRALSMVPDLAVRPIESGCCGMAGSFGYEAEHYRTSMRMAELDLLPALRAARARCLVVAGGTSCRQQIRDGAGRAPWHPAEVLAAALPPSAPPPDREAAPRGPARRDSTHAGG